MKSFTLALSVALVIGATGCEQKPGAVSVKKAETLSPEDVGIGKYVFEVKLPVGKVLVVRCTETVGGKKRGQVLDSIRFADGEPVKDVIPVYDSSKFPFWDDKEKVVNIRAHGGQGSYGGRYVRSSVIAPTRLKLELEGKDKEDVELQLFV